MIIIRLALRNLLRQARKTILLGTLIAVGVFFLFCSNALFESAGRGLEASFVRSLTGDFVLSAPTDETFGLFGSEIPIVSEYESIPPISDYVGIRDVLDQSGKVEAYAPIVSVAASLQIESYSVKVPVFGVDPESYFRVCSDIEVLSGDTHALSGNGVFLNETLANAATAALGRHLVPGEDINFSMYANGSFRIRRGVFAGVHRYPAPNEALDRVVLADPSLVRALCDYTMGYALKRDNTMDSTVNGTVNGVDPAELNFDLDDLFGDAQDIQTANENPLSLEDVRQNLADNSTRNLLVQTDAAALSFVLVRALPSRFPSFARSEVEGRLRRTGVSVRVLDWRIAAGSVATILFAVRAAFNAGVGFILFGAVLVIMNALVVSVLERSVEIGSMRALGASRSFIRRLFVAETMTLTLASSIFGITAGVVACYLLQVKGIPLTNPLLISLFGGNSVRPFVNLAGIAKHLVGASLVGAVAWIYPVGLALRIKPVSAMAEQ